MMTERKPITGHGIVQECLREDQIYRTRMPNGYEILAHLSKPLKDAGAEFEVGDSLEMEFSSWNMKQAKIIAGPASRVDRATVGHLEEEEG